MLDSDCSPMHLTLPASIVRRFLRFRSGCSDLPIDRGRMGRVPRHLRICPACDDGLLCDEFHVIFECAALTSLRQEFRSLFTLSTITMSTFMWQQDTHMVARFVTQALNLILDD